MIKTLKIGLVIFTTIILFSCGSDDPDVDVVTCMNSDWVGVYVGTEECNGDPAEDATITITESDSTQVIITIETAGSTVEFDPITTTDCSLTKTDSDQGITLTIDASLDGNSITIDTDFNIGGGSSLCTYSGTK